MLHLLCFSYVFYTAIGGDRNFGAEAFEATLIYLTRCFLIVRHQRHFCEKATKKTYDYESSDNILNILADQVFATNQSSLVCILYHKVAQGTFFSSKFIWHKPKTEGVNMPLVSYKIKLGLVPSSDHHSAH